MLAGVGDIIQELRLMLIWIWFCFKSIVNCSNAMLVEWRFLDALASLKTMLDIK